MHLSKIFDHTTLKENPSNVFVDERCQIRCHKHFDDRTNDKDTITFPFGKLSEDSMYDVVPLDLPTLSEVAYVAGIPTAGPTIVKLPDKKALAPMDNGSAGKLDISPIDESFDGDFGDFHDGWTPQIGKEDIHNSTVHDEPEAINGDIDDDSEDDFEFGDFRAPEEESDLTSVVPIVQQEDVPYDPFGSTILTATKADLPFQNSDFVQNSMLGLGSSNDVGVIGPDSENEEADKFGIHDATEKDFGSFEYVQEVHVESIDATLAENDCSDNAGNDDDDDEGFGAFDYVPDAEVGPVEAEAATMPISADGGISDGDVDDDDNEAFGSFEDVPKAEAEAVPAKISETGVSGEEEDFDTFEDISHAITEPVEAGSDIEPVQIPINENDLSPADMVEQDQHQAVYGIVSTIGIMDHPAVVHADADFGTFDQYQEQTMVQDLAIESIPEIVDPSGKEYGCGIGNNFGSSQPPAGITMPSTPAPPPVLDQPLGSGVPFQFQMPAHTLEAPSQQMRAWPTNQHISSEGFVDSDISVDARATAVDPHLMVGDGCKGDFNNDEDEDEDEDDDFGDFHASASEVPLPGTNEPQNLDPFAYLDSLSINVPSMMPSANVNVQDDVFGSAPSNGFDNVPSMMPSANVNVQGDVFGSTPSNGFDSVPSMMPSANVNVQGDIFRSTSSNGFGDVPMFNTTSANPPIANVRTDDTDDDFGDFCDAPSGNAITDAFASMI